MFRPLAQEIARPMAERMSRALPGDVTEYVGFASIKDPGEAVISIPFPVRFFEKPSFTFGFELGENIAYTWGEVPTVSACVGRWVIGRRGETGAVFYDGAEVALVTTGPAEFTGILHYRFKGRALTGEAGQLGNPVGTG